MSAVSGEVELGEMFVSEQLTRGLLNITQDVAVRCVRVLAEKYHFDADEAIRMLGLSMIKLNFTKTKSSTKKAKVVEPKVVEAKPAFPLPYNGEFNDACCYALRQNNGLYTQCTSIRNGDEQFCKGCARNMQKTGAEIPDYGTIQQRLAVGILDYVDPKGRKPIAYAKIMKKHNITQDDVIEEAGKFNITIDPLHFVVPEDTKRGRPKTEKEAKEKGVKGRPKKSNQVLSIEGDEDLFEALVAEANETETILPKKNGKTDEEKETERLAKEAEKAEKEAKLAAEKAAKKKAAEEEKAAKKKAAEEEKAAKKKAVEEEKAAKKKAAEEKAAKKKADDEEKAAKKKADDEEKAAKKKTDDEENTQNLKNGETVDEDEDEDEDEEPDVVKKIEFGGNKYLKSKKTGIIYDYSKYVKEGQQVVVGKWNNNTNKIDFNKEDESEEEYDEYDD